MTKPVKKVEDLRGVLLAWLNDKSSSKPETYLTKEGMSYLNGYLQGQNTLGMVNIEEYDRVLQLNQSLIDQEMELVDKYEKTKKALSSYENRDKLIKFINKILRR